MADPMRDDDRTLIEQARTRLVDGIEVVDDEFSRLPPDERARQTRAWLDSLKRDEPLVLGVSAAEVLAEVRREEGWE